MPAHQGDLSAISLISHRIDRDICKHIPDGKYAIRDKGIRHGLSALCGINVWQRRGNSSSKRRIRDQCFVSAFQAELRKFSTGTRPESRFSARNGKTPDEGAARSQIDEHGIDRPKNETINRVALKAALPRRFHRDRHFEEHHGQIT